MLLTLFHLPPAMHLLVTIKPLAERAFCAVPFHSPNEP